MSNLNLLNDYKLDSLIKLLSLDKVKKKMIKSSQWSFRYGGWLFKYIKVIKLNSNTFFQVKAIKQFLNRAKLHRKVPCSDKQLHIQYYHIFTYMYLLSVKKSFFIFLM